MRPSSTELRESLRLLVITDGSAADHPDAASRLLARVESALVGGASAIMLREKTCDSQTLHSLALQLRESTLRHKALLIINDRVDIALAARADGVHLGWRSMPLDVVRALVGPDMLIGASTHSIEEIDKFADADFVSFGPVFPTPSKDGLVEVQGLDGLRSACGRFPQLPIIGLGGIDADNAASVRAAGAAGVAMIRSVLASADPARACRAILQEIKNGAS